MKIFNFIRQINFLRALSLSFFFSFRNKLQWDSLFFYKYYIDILLTWVNYSDTPLGSNYKIMHLIWNYSDVNDFFWLKKMLMKFDYITESMRNYGYCIYCIIYSLKTIATQIVKIKNSYSPKWKTPNKKWPNEKWEKTPLAIPFTCSCPSISPPSLCATLASTIAPMPPTKD